MWAHESVALAARCEVTGPYTSLCRFLSELTERGQPIACSEIALRRASDIDSRHDRNTARCTATVSLRIPYAAGESAAGQLLSGEAPHDS